MIWSVSTFSAASGRSLDVNDLMGCMGPLIIPSRVRDLPLDCARGCGERRGKERSRAFTLPAFKVAVAGADRVLARADGVAVHGETHGAASFAPLRARRFENLVQPFL